MKIEKYEDLESYLENWTNFHGDIVPYDFNGALNLLAALLRNMKKHANASDFENLNNFFDKDELHILKLMFEKLSSRLDIK